MYDPRCDSKGNQASRTRPTHSRSPVDKEVGTKRVPDPRDSRPSQSGRPGGDSGGGRSCQTLGTRDGPDSLREGDSAPRGGTLPWGASTPSSRSHGLGDLDEPRVSTRPGVPLAPLVRASPVDGPVPPVGRGSPPSSGPALETHSDPTPTPSDS